MLPVSSLPGNRKLGRRSPILTFDCLSGHANMERSLFFNIARFFAKWRIANIFILYFLMFLFLSKSASFQAGWYSTTGRHWVVKIAHRKGRKGRKTTTTWPLGEKPGKGVGERKNEGAVAGITRFTSARGRNGSSVRSRVLGVFYLLDLKKLGALLRCSSFV